MPNSDLLASPPADEFAPAAKLLLKHFEGGGDWTAAELIDATALAPDTVYKNLRMLESEGLVERRYSIANRGQSLFKLAEGD